MPGPDHSEDMKLRIKQTVDNGMPAKDVAVCLAPLFTASWRPETIKRLEEKEERHPTWSERRVQDQSGSSGCWKSAQESQAAGQII